MSLNELPAVLTPVATPFDSDWRPDLALLEHHCRWLLSEGSGLAVFGTNSEGNSMSVGEKRAILDHLVDAGLPPGQMMPGTGSSALTDAVELTRHATSLGCGGVLLLPPFFYKGVSDEGIYRYVAEIAERVADPRLRIYLYHIPPVAQVGYSHDLIERLITAFPEVVAGIKDSSGDFNNTRQMLARFPGWGIYAGNEMDLVEAMALGARGCISATCNINAGNIVRLASGFADVSAAERQQEVNRVRAEVGRYAMIPALKSVAAQFYGEPAWARVRPPLVELSAAEASSLARALREHPCSMSSPA